MLLSVPPSGRPWIKVGCRWTVVGMVGPGNTESIQFTQGGKGKGKQRVKADGGRNWNWNWNWSQRRTGPETSPATTRSVDSRGMGKSKTAVMLMMLIVSYTATLDRRLPRPLAGKSKCKLIIISPLTRCWHINSVLCSHQWTMAKRPSFSKSVMRSPQVHGRSLRKDCLAMGLIN